MGRWAQRRRGGGGGPNGTSSLISITNASSDDLNTVTLTYSAPVTDSDFTSLDFTSQASGLNPTTIVGGTPTTLELTFTLPITGDTLIQYTGTVAGVLTPQTVAY